MHSAPVKDFQKEKFELFMNEQYRNLHPEGSFTEEKAGFLRTFVMQAEEDNFDCDNFMWLIAFRNHLTEAASISNRGTVEGLKALPLDEKLERLNQWILVAVAAFKAANDDLGEEFSIEKGILVAVAQDISVTKVAVTFVIDLLQYLCFRHMPRSNSWQFAGESYLLKEFVDDIYTDLNPDGIVAIVDEEATGHHNELAEAEGYNDEWVEEEEPSEGEPKGGEVITEWKKGTKLTNYIKLLWHNYIAIGLEDGSIPWNPSDFAGIHLRAVIEQFNGDEYETLRGGKKIIISDTFLGPAQVTVRVRVRVSPKMN
jgi:hypothetical protein